MSAATGGNHCAAAGEERAKEAQWFPEGAGAGAHSEGARGDIMSSCGRAAVDSVLAGACGGQNRIHQSEGSGGGNCFLRRRRSGRKQFPEPGQIIFGRTEERTQGEYNLPKEPGLDTTLQYLFRIINLIS